MPSGTRLPTPCLWFSQFSLWQQDSSFFHSGKSYKWMDPLWHMMVILVYSVKICRVHISSPGWSTARWCTRWRTILPSLATTSSMWCCQFCWYYTSTGLFSYHECFTSLFSARCVLPCVFFFSYQKQCKFCHVPTFYVHPHFYPFFCGLSLSCSWKVMTGVTKRRRIVTHQRKKHTDWVTWTALESEGGQTATDTCRQRQGRITFE